MGFAGHWLVGLGRKTSQKESTFAQNLGTTHYSTLVVNGRALQSVIELSSKLAPVMKGSSSGMSKKKTAQSAAHMKVRAAEP